MAEITNHLQKGSNFRPGKAKRSIFVSAFLCFRCFYLDHPFFFQDKVYDSNTRKKWRPWSSPSEGFGPSSKRGHVAASERSDFDYAFTAVVRAAPKNFNMARQKGASIRIHTAFQGLLLIFFIISIIIFAVN